MKAKILFILGLSFLWVGVSCQKAKEIVPPGPGSTFDTQMQVLFVDESGNNLLHDGNFYHLKLYYIIDGKEQEVYYTHFHGGNPRMMTMVSKEYGDRGEQNVFGMLANTAGNDKITTALLKWETHTDVIRTELERRPNVLRVTKVWWNDELVWDVSIGKKQYEDGIRMGNRFFEVVR